jgi:S-adenosylmethionine decarboxylase proenzyme
MVGTVSQHLLCEYWGCDAALLDDEGALESLLRRAAQQAGATVVGAAFHRLVPQGVSGVVVLEESHFCIHTWPERGYASADLFTCGACCPGRGHELIAHALGAAAVEVLELARGLDPPGRGIRVVRHEPAR